MASRGDRRGRRGTWPAGPAFPAPMFVALDALRRGQGRLLDQFGFGVRETPFKVVAEGRRWRLRRYAGGGEGPAVLAIPAPIKRPWIWDLAPSVSPIRAMLGRGFDVFLLDWKPPRAGDRGGGLEAYAGTAPGEALDALASARGRETRPVLLGHSLGGTLAAIHAALHSERIGGLGLVGAPLCFGPQAGRFGAAFSALAPMFLREGEAVPGSAASMAAAAASPAGFVWSRMIDAAAAMGDPEGMRLLIRAERWAMEEVPLSARLFREVLDRLYRRDELGRGVLRIGGATAGPQGVRVPVLAAACADDVVAPPGSVSPFLDALPAGQGRLIAFPGERGAGMAHVALLTGRRARRELWPLILDWIAAAD
ncbi:MAG: alpha/beta hydrolase [Pseudomonadota bacterium]